MYLFEVWLSRYSNVTLSKNAWSLLLTFEPVDIFPPTTTRSLLFQNLFAKRKL